MIEIQDFIVERGGDPKKIKESQRRRHAPEEVVDEVITLWEDHRKSKEKATQLLQSCCLEEDVLIPS